MNIPDNGGEQTAPGQADFLPASVRNLTRELSHLWAECEGHVPLLGRTFTRLDRAPREKALAGFIDRLRAEAKHPPRTKTEADGIQQRILSGYRHLARTAFDWEDRHFDALLSGGFDRAALEFTRRARQFDPAVSPGDIFQAWRNVWVMNGLQSLLGLPVRLSPAVFAYSLLYPYTDNIIDDPDAAEALKQAFNERLKRRLEGQAVAPSDGREKKVFDLLGLIEGEFERSRHPQVFQSLLAIQQAQVQSVRLLGRDGAASGDEILAIVLEKGGTSVLADGCLVAGSLTPDQAEFLFGLGAYLQLIDDLEDVRGDARDGLLTVFSRAAGHRPLDSLTDQALCFGLRVLDGLPRFAAPGTEAFQEVMRSGVVGAFITFVGRDKRLYSRAYFKALETHSAFRFSFFNRQRRKLFRRRVLLERLFEAFAHLSLA